MTNAKQQVQVDGKGVQGIGGATARRRGVLKPTASEFEAVSKHLSSIKSPSAIDDADVITTCKYALIQTKPRAITPLKYHIGSLIEKT